MDPWKRWLLTRHNATTESIVRFDDPGLLAADILGVQTQADAEAIARYCEGFSAARWSGAYWPSVWSAYSEGTLHEDAG